jgi:drug/metabolite transporter (DMT)-like permease
VLISLGFWGGLGHYLLIIAHRWAPAPTIAPFTYVQLIAVTVIGYLVFGDLPDVWTAVGSAIIVASGIYLLRREQAVESGRS